MKLVSLKLATIAALTALSSSAFGSVIFKKDSAVYVDLQDYIASKFEEKCRLTRGDRVQLVEDNTYTRVARIDQGMADYYYTTTFNAYRVRNSYNAGFIGQVEIQSVRYAIYNGNNLEVLSIKTPDYIHCK